jgi:hypothetical protein
MELDLMNRIYWEEIYVSDEGKNFITGFIMSVLFLLNDVFLLAF